MALHLILLLLLAGTTEVIAGPLLVEPSFLLVAEDWEPGKPLEVAICPAKAKIVSGNTRNTFSIAALNDSCATLQLNAELDADKEWSEGVRGQSFSLVLGGSGHSRASLEIQVVDVNDNSPEFVGAPAVISVPEDTPVGSSLTKLRTRDVDTGVAGLARYSVEGDQFSLDRRKCSNGECWTTLRLNKALDFEKQRVHHVTVTARDGDPSSNHSNSATHSIDIHVTDVQDAGPVWVTDLAQPLSIPSTAMPGDEVMVLTASDGDTMAEKKNKIKYSMQDNDHLSVNAATGSVTLKKKPIGNVKLTLEVTAREDDNSSMAITGKLNVQSSGEPAVAVSQVSTDVCQSEVTTGKIKEGAKTFEKPLVVYFKRPVTASEAFIEGASRTFAISTESTDGVGVVVREPSEIDYEKTKSIEFYVSSSIGRCRVVVEVLDANDNSPKFEHDTFLFYVTENHRPTVLGEVKATDADSSEFLPITYSILGEGASLFSISDKGEVRSLVPVDRETNDRFDLVIRATDAGGRWTDCPGKVVVRDINDNSPSFEKEHYEIELDEEKSQKQRIIAADPDLGENGQITYSIDELPDGQPIHMSSGILFIGKLDRDTMEGDRVELVLRATDKGEPPRSTTANLTIRVKDINDNYPMFSNSRYSIVLDANISPGGVIGAVKADDADATSPNNYVRYETDDGRFRVADGGEIIYTGEGVLAKDSCIEFSVVAVDGGSPPRNSSCRVAINEHLSSLKSQLTTELIGNDTNERAEVIWANSGMNGYSYEIVRASSEGFKDAVVRKWVDIDSKTGRINTVKVLSPDNVKEIRLQISMTKGKREVPVELIIKVVDSDAAPFFKKDNYKTSVAEDTAKGTKLLQVKANGDDGEHFKYSIAISRGPKNALSIDNKGWITNQLVLDYEKYRVIQGTIQAEDQLGNNAITNFSIQLIDSNDNRPVFKNGSVFTVYLNESAAIGTELKLPYPLATDADSGANAELQYSIIGGDGQFDIDNRTSVIHLIGELDFESQRAHSLTLRCIDKGDKKGSHEAFAAVTIIVRDVNDNKPVLHNSDLNHLSVSEDSAPGTLITVLSVTDADEGGKQAVSITTNHSLFRMDDRASLLVAAPLKGYAGERMCSSIVVTDAGMPPLSSSHPYCVTIYPAANNHHNPLIVSPKPNSIHYFDENVKYDELLRIKLLEEGDMRGITYKLDTNFKKDWEGFSINSTGSLSASAPFDFEKKNVHELKVEACRSSNCSSVHVFISVNDRNDNCPIFPKQDVRLSLSENDKSALPRQVGRIPVALDADFHPDNTKVCYSTDSPLFFFLDPTLPVIYTNNSFDREQQKEHKITIVAYDCLLSCRDPHKPMNGSIVGLITVVDVNDNFPKFTETSYHATVIQGQAAAGSHLTTVSATDSDEETDGLKYAIRGAVRAGKQSLSLEESPISVDPSTGEVSANSALREPLYSFSVSVTDGAGHEDTARVTISVVTYAQQTELLFDAPFDFIVRNEKHIVSLLSEASSLNAVVDRCRQNANFTLVLAHFLDNEGKFVNVEDAVDRLSSSNGTARRELRNAYGMREASATMQTRHATIDAVAIAAAAALLLLLLLVVCIWCRQKNNYDSKLRQISVQAAAHHATLGRPIKKAPAYFVEGAGPILATGRMLAPAPPLLSTEL